MGIIPQGFAAQVYIATKMLSGFRAQENPNCRPAQAKAHTANALCRARALCWHGPWRRHDGHSTSNGRRGQGKSLALGPGQQMPLGDHGPWSMWRSTMLPHETLWYYLSSRWRLRSFSRDRPGADLYRGISIGPVSCKQMDGARGVRVRGCLLSHGFLVAGDLPQPPNPYPLTPKHRNPLTPKSRNP